MSFDCSDVVKTAQMKNFTWHMTRQINPTEQNVCGWTGFNIMTRDKIAVNQDIVGYLPTINAPATAMSTVNEVLTQALKIIESPGIKEMETPRQVPTNCSENGRVSHHL